MNPHKIDQRGAFILAWTIRSTTLDRGLRQTHTDTDHYSVHDTFADAEKAYDFLRKRHDLYSATIAMTWQSTDYERIPEL